MTTYPGITFKKGAVEPIECLKQGWELVKPRYWLFVGMSAVAIVIGSVVPFGILLGPMMCGMYIALLKTRRGQFVEFGDLFKGFDHFGQSVIATLIHVVPIMVVFVPTYIAFYVSLFMMMPRNGDQPDSAMMMSVMGAFAVFYLFIIIFIIIVSVLFTFSYPLIVDRGLSGVDAVRLSVKAALANFWRLLGLFLLSGVMGFVGILLCYVGVFLVLPISFGAIASVYEQVFGLGTPVSNLPPPPPTFH